MHKLICTFIAILLFTSVYGQCTYCTSLQDALVDPERVRSLNLKGKGLENIPEEVALLTYLESLDLSNNFIGEIKYDQFKLSNLRELRLAGNPSFNGMFFKGIGDAFPNLERLILNNCNINYISEDLAELKYLKELNLSNNAVKFLPSEISIISGLENINLDNNDLTDTYFLKELWNVKTFSAANNPKLNLREIGSAFLFKEGCEQITLNPYNDGFKIPDEFIDVDVEEIIFKGSSFSTLNHKLCRNKSIKKIVVENTKIDNGFQFTSWINKFENLEELEFRNIKVPAGIKDIIVPKLTFTNCELTNKSELKQISPKVYIVSNNTDITNGKYIGNAVMANNVELRSNNKFDFNSFVDFASNTFEPVVSTAPRSFQINSTTSNWVEMEESQYAIPKDAFLNRDGSLYTGAVELKITEFMDPIINALADVPMIINIGDKNELFSSNGMIDFRAYDGAGNELSPNPDNIIQVQLKDLQSDVASNLYVFNEETSNWDTIGRPQPTNYDDLYAKYLDSLNKIPDENFVNLNVVDIPVFLKYKKSKYDPYELDFFTRGSSNKTKIKNNKERVNAQNFDQDWLCRKVNWKIDTIITEELKNTLNQIKKHQKKVFAYWDGNLNMDYYYVPRLIKNLKITPNLEHDNYTLSFEFLDTLRSIPVYPAFGGSIRKIQEQERKNYLEYEKNRKLAEKEKVFFENYKKNRMKKIAESERIKRAEVMVNLQKFRDNPKLQGSFSTSFMENNLEEYNQFGLTSFGLVNCDYFFRNIPDDILAMDSVATDYEGRFVKMPPTVRNIFLEDKTFITTRSDLTPVFKDKKVISFIVLSAIEIGIITNKLQNGLTRPTVKKINIDGLTPKQVRSRIIDTGT